MWFGHDVLESAAEEKHLPLRGWVAYTFPFTIQLAALFADEAIECAAIWNERLGTHSSILLWVAIS